MSSRSRGSVPLRRRAHVSAIDCEVYGLSGLGIEVNAKLLTR